MEGREKQQERRKKVEEEGGGREEGGEGRERREGWKEYSAIHFLVFSSFSNITLKLQLEIQDP